MGNEYPEKIGYHSKGLISEQIIEWMIYIENYRSDDLPYNDMIDSLLFSSIGPQEYHGFINSKSDKEDIYGGVTYWIANPVNTNPNLVISHVGQIQELQRLYIRLVPQYGGGSRGTIVINLDFIRRSEYYRISIIIFRWP